MSAALELEQLYTRLATVVGAEHVSALPDSAHYSGLLAPHVDAPARPRALVRPASAEQVQRLAPMIGELGHSLWSSANQCGNGAYAGHPRKPGVLLDLSRMNRIVEVDRRAACAVIEAGVSYAQLAQHLHERDLPLWLDADSNGAHAVAGSIAVRQWGLTPYGDHQAALCGVEAVLANGSLLRTGMGGVPGSTSWPRYKYSFGPAFDGLFSGEHFGVVTRLGLWLMPTPRRFRPFGLALPSLASVAAVVERLRPLLQDGSLGGRMLLASHNSDAALLARCMPQAPAPDGAPWTLYGALYGLPDNVEYYWQRCAEAAHAAAGAALSDSLAGPLWPLRVRQLRGESLYNDAAGDHARGLWFTMLAPCTGADAQALHRGVLKRLAEFAPRLSFMLAPRLLAMQVELAPDSGPFEATSLAALAAVKTLVNAGYGLMHSAPALAPTLAARHTPAGLRHLYDGLHTALDPFAVLATRGRFKRGKS